MSLEDPYLPVLLPGKLGKSPLSARLPHHSFEARPLALQQGLGKESRSLASLRAPGGRLGPGLGQALDPSGDSSLFVAGQFALPRWSLKSHH